MNETSKYSEVAVRNNAYITEYCRISMSILSGCTAGILGLNGLYGFLFFFISLVILWCMFLAKVGRDHNKYFVSKIDLLTNGFVSGLCTYVTFWTFFYGLVHVY